MNYILYHDNSSLTGRELRRELGIQGGTGSPTERPDRLIRWGNRAEVRFNARMGGGVLNKKQALIDAGNKGRAIELLAARNVQVPPEATTFNGELLVGRTENHVGGSGLFLVASNRDFELARDHLHCTHFMKYIPCHREFRVHVFRGQVIGVGEKLMQNNATSLHIRNVDTGWTFRYIEDAPDEIRRLGIDAVACLGLDFGAVDIIKSVNRNLYVLEVNTAPSLVQRERQENGPAIDHGPMFNAYITAFRSWLAGH